MNKKNTTAKAAALRENLRRRKVAKVDMDNDGWYRTKKLGIPEEFKDSTGNEKNKPK